MITFKARVLGFVQKPFTYRKGDKIGQQGTIDQLVCDGDNFQPFRVSLPRDFDTKSLPTFPCDANLEASFHVDQYQSITGLHIVRIAFISGK